MAYQDLLPDFKQTKKEVKIIKIEGKTQMY